MRLLVVSPALFGSGTGAATYYRLLAAGLHDRGVHVGVISDTESGTFAGEHFPLFPSRVVRDKRFVRDSLLLAFQQLQYFQLPRIVDRFDPATVLVHDSFFNYRGAFETVFRRLRKQRPDIRWVVDVRGRQLKRTQAAKLAGFDAAIACSDNVAAFLDEAGLSPASIDVIPVVQEPLRIDSGEASAVVREHGLRPQQYVLYGGLIKRSKAVDLLIRAFESMANDPAGVELALAGPMKDESRELRELCHRPRVRMLGRLPRATLLALMAEARVCAHVSPSEGLPRFSLEALALGRPCLLPPSVPEFVRHAPEFVACSTDPQVLGSQLCELVRDPRSVDRYPIEKHYPDAVVPQYLSVLFPESFLDVVEEVSE